MTRAPTLAEAVYFLKMKEHTRAYRRECLRYWRERYGEVFVKQVEASVTIE